MNRPLVWVSLSFIAGILAAAHDLLPGLAAPAVVLLAGIGAIYVHIRYAPRSLSIVLCFAASGALLYNARHAGPPGDPLAREVIAQPDAFWTLEGRVERPTLLLPGEEYGSFILRVDRAEANGDPLPVEGGVSVRWSEPAFALFADDRVRVQGALSLRLRSVNPGVQDVEDYLRRNGVHSGMRVRGEHDVERLADGRATSLAYWASRLRYAEAVRLAEAMPASVLPFILEVWLGDRGGVEQEEYQQFVRSGTAHILSVSGLHTAIVFTSAYYVLRMLVGIRRARIAFVMALVFAFALVAGARVATMRAAIMVMIYLLAEWFDRESDIMSALGTSALLFLVIDPDLLFDSGFLLSFSSVASILLFADRLLKPFDRLPRSVGQALSSTLAVQILPFPLAVRFFHVFPVFAPLANVIVIPLLAAALWLAFLASIFAFVWPSVAPLFGHALAPVVHAITFTARIVATQPWSYLNITSPSVIAVACYWLLVILLCRRPKLPRKRRVWAGALALVAVTMLLTWQPLRRNAELVFLDVGQGDATFVLTEQGDTILVDAGDRSEYVDMGMRVVAPYLWSAGVTSLDYLIVTHPDRDHIGGAMFIVEQFRVGEVLLSGISKDQVLEQELLATCTERDVPVRRLWRGESIPLRGGKVEVLHPPRTWPAESKTNDQSLVLRISLGAFQVLLPGDIEEFAEKSVAELDCKATILKAPHHGSRTSSTPVFLDAVAPEYAVASAGDSRSRQVLSETVMARYAAHGIPVWRTDWHGGVRVRFEGNDLRIEGERLRRGYLTPRAP